MRPKFRIVTQDGKFYVQKKWLLFWETLAGGFDHYSPRAFDSQVAAQEWVDQLNARWEKEQAPKNLTICK